MKVASVGEETFAMHCKIYGLAPVRELAFSSPRKWRFDFAFPDHKIAVEVEGGQWTGGRHQRGSGFEADCEKYNVAALLGWRVLRFTTAMVERGRAIDVTLDALGVRAHA